MASHVVALCPCEFPQEDAGAIVDICNRLGPDTAVRVLSQRVQELAASVAGLVSQVHLPERADVQWHSRRVQKLALGLGLIGLAHIAGDLRRSHSDPTAFAAVSARLERVAGRSLAALPRDRTGA